MTFALEAQEPSRKHDRVDAWDDDPTPRGVVRAVLKAAIVEHGYLDGVNSDPLRVLDLGAGFGCWSSEMRKLALEQGWPVHITGVEINPQRGPDLAKWCDAHASCCWREHLGALCILEDMEESVGISTPKGYDLVLGNPPFTELLREAGEFPRREDGELAPERTMVPVLLEHAPAVLFLHTQQALLRSVMGRAVQRRAPPVAAWQIPGAVSFRADGKADSRCYETSLWLRDHTGPCSRTLLDDLSTRDLRWSHPAPVGQKGRIAIVPGSESPMWAQKHGYPLAPGYQ